MRSALRATFVVRRKLRRAVLAKWSEDLIPLRDARNLDGLFFHRVRRSPERIAYMSWQGGKGWQTHTWGEMASEVARWREALLAEGLGPGDRVAILLRNCPDWVVFDQASLSLGLVTVPLYTDDRPDNAAYILRDSAAKLVLVQDTNRWRRLSEALDAGAGLARVVICESNRDFSRLAGTDPRVVRLGDWLPASGRPLAQRKGAPDELATIVYTSGTTGRPKGVMLSHGNILSNAHASLTAIDCYQEDLFLSFLPLSHSLERTGGYYLPMMAGATVAFARAVGQLAEDLQSLRPTVLIAVPRVFERVYDRMMTQLRSRSAVARWVFGTAIRAGWRRFERAQGRAGWHPLLLLWPILRRLTADKLRNRLGGRLRIAVSGGAALPKEVARAFIGLGIPIVQGYGLTETSPVVSVNRLVGNDPESVGPPLRGIEVRIGEADELLVRGPCNMLGYWNDHVSSARMVDADGWLHTGDQGRIGARGHLYITGRIKDILVLSNGEKVPPADMEMAIALDPLFEQALVIGEGRSFLSALLVLNGDIWNGLAREYGLNPERVDSLSDPRLLKDMLKRVRGALREFPGYAKIRRVTLLLEPWSVENGLLTPTLKIKRGEVLKRYRDAVEEMYDLED
jgi:long-chain acyl-CoA synthetase